jgi:hypothetical protein
MTCALTGSGSLTVKVKDPVGVRTMATLTQVTLTCDVCGNAKGVQTRRIGLDGQVYEVDLCPKDSKGLDKAAAGYVSKARKGTTSPGPRKARASRAEPRNAKGSRNAKASRVEARKAKAAPERAMEATGSRQETRATRARQETQATRGRQERGVYVYGIFPEDIEVTKGMPGVGENPGVMRVVRSSGLAALISEVDGTGQLGSPDDLRVHSKILDAAAAEVPVLPLPFGMVLASEQAVAEELLAAHHGEFAKQLEELEGQAQFVVRGRYAAPPGTAEREEDVRALHSGMQEHCAASITHEPANEPDEVDVAFLVPGEKESEVERVIGQLSGDWAGRIELQLLGPMAAYDFVTTTKPGR